MERNSIIQKIHGVIKTIDNSDFSAKISSSAYSKVKGYTWEKRAENILNFLK